MKTHFVFVTVVVLAACGGGSKKAADNPSDPAATPPTAATVAANQRAMASLRDLERTACACKVVACIDQVNADVMAWSKKTSDDADAKDLTQLSEADKQESIQIMFRITECMRVANASELEGGSP